MKILIAEDDSTSLRILEASVRKWGYEPVGAEDGLKAWQVLQEDNPPKLLLVDWMMPELSGVELCKRIRKEETDDPSFIILLTARSSTEDIVRGLEAGANEYIAKPFNKAELQARLKVGRRMILLQEKQKSAEMARNRLQKELAVTRKMETLGHITGSIAHDFNNILGIITGYTRMAVDRYGDEVPAKMKEYLLTAIKSSERAKRLVDKMLTYTHGDVNTTPESLQLAREIEANVNGLSEKFSDTIDIKYHVEDNIPDILISHTGLQQLLFSICDNAKDAMDGCGTIVIDVRLRKALNDECISCYKLLEGNWVEISVTDTGKGMPREILEQIFEPFYTTKSMGQGMGMAMALGIVHRAGGHFLIESALDKGSKITVLFPPETQGSD